MTSNFITADMIEIECPRCHGQLHSLPTTKVKYCRFCKYTWCIPVTKVCKRCGKEFTIKWASKYCLDCRPQAYNQRFHLIGKVPKYVYRLPIEYFNTLPTIEDKLNYLANLRLDVNDIRSQLPVKPDDDTNPAIEWAKAVKGLDKSEAVA